ncbi:response regulator transcription factor [Pseudofrankia sp. DC12]|uniref:response regulator transcription factor n=1 Tax=Pseudofrankia sp. DC12 TaxID=683315 RepID=UPI000A8F2509|nr:response regulator transcription factor [Pseudofrankia sp. DC12]
MSTETAGSRLATAPAAEPAAERPRLLLVEDEPSLADLLTGVLKDAGYEVECAFDGQRALHLGLTRPYDVVVLDLGLPVVDGMDVLRAWRTRSVVVPVLILTARGAVADRVEGLDGGADDFLVKPFGLDELFARLRAVRRQHLDRAAHLPLPDGRRLDLANRTVSDLPANAPGHEAANVKGYVRLSERESALLAALAARPLRAFTRDELRERLFPYAEPAVVAVYVHYLRRKLGRSVIRTVRGVGYQLGGQR